MVEKQTRSGFSLLEMLLTLAMSVVLLTLISQAIRYYAIELTSVEDDYHAALIATTTLQMLEDDLRSTAIGQPVAMDAMAARIAAATGVESAPAAVGGESGDPPPPPDPPSDAGETGDAGAMGDLPIDGIAPAPDSIGLAGGIDWLRLDVRSPVYLAPPEVQAADLAMQSAPRSDLQTVSYWMDPNPIDPAAALRQISGDVAVPLATTTAAAGLARQSVDRAAALQASLTGVINQGILISPEITAVQFEYYDGTLWQTQYDSVETATLPRAIRVTLALGTDRTFTHTIGLPIAPGAEELVDPVAEEPLP